MRLLDLQELDTAADQLAHRRRTLPELAELDRVRAESTTVHDLLIGAETEQSDLQREVDKAEADVESIRQRAQRDRQRMDSGSVGSAKELESLAHELETLARRQQVLEEVELDAMERLETAQARVGELMARRDGLATELASLEARCDELVAAIDADAADLTQRRAATVIDIPADLLALYEKLRAERDGVGAAPLLHGSCQGCRLQLTAVDLGRMRVAPADEVLRCEECRRILVRTPESGI